MFDHWEGGASGTANPVNVVVNGNTAVRAVFVPRFTVTVTVEGSGSVDPNGGTFDGGSQINLTATPTGQDVYFIEWQGDLSGSDNPATLTVDGHKNVTAVFAKKFQVNTYTVGNGAVTPPSGLFREGTEVEFTATPATDWAFDRWSGDLPGGVNRYIEATSTQIERAMDVYAHFIERPGLSDLDMVGDLNYYLQATGEGATASTFDRNGVDYDEDWERVYVGNGILDAAELYLLQTALSTRNLDLTRRGAIAHDPVWAAWATNLAQASADLTGYDARIVRVVAGYMTLGTFESVEFIRSHVEEAFTGVTLDPADYDRSRQRYLNMKRDADNDGISNGQEWQLASPEVLLVDLPDFAAAALDGQRAAGFEPPTLQPSGCDNDACLDRGSLSVQAFLGPPPDNCQISGSPIGEGIALGTPFQVTATPDSANGWGFWVWLAQDTSMIDGSRELEEYDRLQGNVTATAVFARVGLKLPKAGGAADITITPSDGAIIEEDEDFRYVYGPPGSEVTLTAESTLPGWIVVDWELKGGVGYADPRYSREKSVTLPLGGGYARPRLYTQAPNTKRLQVPAMQGGMVHASQSTGWGGIFLHTVAVDESCLVDLAAIANPGWEFVEWQMEGLSPAQRADWSLHGLSSTQLNEVSAVFVERKEWTLMVDVLTDEGEPHCAGYVEVTEPKRYYEDQEEVTLTAHPQEVCTSPDQSQIYTGYRFSHWDGDGFAEDSHSNLVEVAGCPDPTITLTMESDRNVTAIFEVRIIYIIALSGEQWDEPPLPGAQIDSGVLHWAQSLRARNPLMFDLNRFDEDHVAGDGSGLVFDELAMAINNGDAREILMVGHSHGGGAIADLCSRIENDPLYQIGDDEEFSIIMTAYVDAISNETLPYTTAPETAYPALTSHHVNLYQTFDSFLWGAPVTNAVPNWNINNALTCASGIDHEHIDDSAYTHAILTDYALWIICGAGLDTDYCD